MEKQKTDNAVRKARVQFPNVTNSIIGYEYSIAEEKSDVNANRAAPPGEENKKKP